MFIAARPVRNSNIIIPTRKTARSCATIGRMPAKPVHSNRSARRARNVVSSGGCTRTFSHALRRLDKNPNAMRTRRETVEHPFGTLKMRMGATHFLCVTLPKVATEMALCVLGYNLTRVLNIVGMKPLLAAVRA